jgi:DNA-directed RNA polymerase specialized sigma24 family protein
MVNHLMDAPCTNDGEASTPAGKIPTEWVSPVSDLSNPLNSEISLPVLAALCTRELDSYRRGEPCTDAYGLELLRRATVQGDQEAWAWVQQCLGGMVRGWLRRHPKREVACRLESEENYVAQTFERFWQATTLNQRIEFSTLAAALQYLRASLHGAILDMLRAYARPRETSLPEPGEPGEPYMEDVTFSSEDWDILKTLLCNPREQRLAYLLFHCGLGPREIVHFCPQEFNDVREVYCLRRTIMERVVRNADPLRWRLS